MHNKNMKQVLHGIDKDYLLFYHKSAIRQNNTTKDYIMKKTILQNIPVPTISNKLNAKYEFHLIKKGQSCLYEGTERELINTRSAAIEYAKRHKLHFVTRTVEGGLMVWNIAQGVVATKTETKSKPDWAE
jgi:hypothetical protein